jgi:hypothetical protein
MNLLIATLVSLAVLRGDAPQRVIVQVDHLRTIHGTIVGESPDGLRILTVQGNEITVNPASAFAFTILLDADDNPEVILQLHSGARLQGTLVADDWTHVELRIHGAPFTVPRDQVVSVRHVPDIKAIYKAQRALLDDTDEAGRLALARWLMDNKSWILAEAELRSLVKHSNSIVAAQLHRRAAAHARLLDPPEKEAGASDEGTGDVQAGTDEASPTSMAAALPPLPNDAIVHLVRVLELDPLDPPPVLIKTDTRRRLFLGWSGNRRLPDTPESLANLLSMDDAQVLRLLFDLRARPLYGEVIVQSRPPSLETFATTVHDAWLTTRCGMQSCHGGSKAGRFQLYRSGRPSDRLRTANLLQLERTVLDGRPMLDWATPGNSLLIQYALPRVQATSPHPQVPGWRPTLNGDRLEALLKWIRSMRQPRPVVPWPSPKAAPLEPATQGDPDEASPPL